MNVGRSFTGCALVLAGLLPALRAQSVIAYPGLNNILSNNVDIYSNVTFAEQSIFDPGVFKVITTSNGADHYLISNNYEPSTQLTYQPVIVLNRYFSGAVGVVPYTGLAEPVTAAVLTPDESQLVLGESTLHVYETSRFTDLTGGVGLTILGASTVTDVAVSYDSLTAYALATDGTNSYLSSISLPAIGTGGRPALVATVPIPGLATNITLGPDGLLYVSLPNEMMEINPITLAPTPTGLIAVTENPGVPVFTPDGNYMVAANITSTPPIESGGCEYFVSPANIVVGNAAQAVTVSVSVSPNALACPWTAVPPSFATVDTASSTLTGSTLLSFVANTTSTNLTGTLSIAGFNIPVTQLSTATPAAPSGAVLVNLNTDTLAGSIPQVSDLNGAYPINQLAVENDQFIYAYVGGNESLYTLQIGMSGGMILTTPALPLLDGLNPQGSIVAFGVSEDPGVVPAAGASTRNAPQFIFLIDNATTSIYSIDPVALTASVGAAEFDANTEITYAYPGCSISNANGGCSFSTPATQLAYGFGAVPGNTQAVPLGATSTPMVIRALDPNGYPLSGLSVTWSLTPPDGQVTTNTVVNAPETLTGADGYAEATITAGTLSTDVGLVPVSATVGGATTPVTFTFTVGAIAPPLPAATLSIVSGQGQLLFADPNVVTLPTLPPCVNPTCPDPAAPLVVLATDSSGNPVNGAVVTFTDAAFPNSIPTTVTTGLNPTLPGQASANFQALLPVIGYPGYATQAVTACTGICPGPLSVTFYLTTVSKFPTVCATPPCTELVLPVTSTILSPPAGTVVTGNAGSTIPNAVQVLVTSTAFGVPLANVGVAVNTGTNLTLPNASCSDPTGSGVALTNSSGVATCSLLLNLVGGTEPLLVSAPAVSAPTTPVGFVSTGSSLTILPSLPATLTILSGNNQSGPAGAGIAPLTVQVNNAAGQPLPGTTITFAATSGSLTFTDGTPVTGTPGPPAVTIITNVDGQAALSGTFGATLGLTTVTATTGNLSAVFTIATGTIAASVSLVSGNFQSAAPNTPFALPLTVQMEDINGNPAPYANISWSVTSVTSATLATPSTGIADATGTASINIAAGSVPGAVSVLALSELSSNQASFTFSLTITGGTSGPANLSILNAADYSTAISVGSLISIFGTNLTNLITGVDTNPVDLANYQLTFNGIAAPILALINENGVQQINAEVPFEISSGTNPVILQTPQGQIQVDNQIVAAEAPAIFENGTVSVNGTDYPQASATRPDGSYVSSTNPAQPGDTITFYATGLGQTSPTTFTGLPGVPGELLAVPLYAAINNQGVQVVSAEYTPGGLGVYTIVIQVPQNVVGGSADPLTLYLVDSTGTGYNAPPVYIPVL